MACEARLTLGARWGLLRPTTRTVVEELIPRTGLRVGISLVNTPTGDGLDGGSHRSRDPYGVGIVPSPTLNTVAGGKESIKTLDEVRVSGEKLRNSVDYPGSINRLALKVFHDVQEPVVDLGLIMELNLDLIEIRKSIIQDRLLALGCGTRPSLLRIRPLGASLRLVLLNGPMSVLRRQGSAK